MSYLNVPLVVLLTVSSLYLFEAAKADKSITLPMRSTHNGQLFYVELGIGRGDRYKSYNMLVATNYPVTWLNSWKIDPIRGYRNQSGDLFENRLHLLLDTGSMYCLNHFYVHYDEMRVSSEVVVPQQAFGLLYKTTYFRGMEPNMDGMLGLNDGVSHPFSRDYLFLNLFKKGHIDHLKFSIYINQSTLVSSTNDNPDEPAGAVVLGGVDEKYFTGQFKYAKLYEDTAVRTFTNKSMMLSGIRLDWSRADRAMNSSLAAINQIDIPLRSRLKLDSSTILFVGDSTILDETHLNMMGTKAILFRGLYAFNDCRLDDKPDFVFSLMGGFDVTITPEDYVVEHELDGRKICLSAFKRGRENLWLFGTKFMRKYYTLFDYENDVVGFATPT